MCIKWAPFARSTTLLSKLYKKVAFIEATSLSLANLSLEKNDQKQNKGKGKDFFPKSHNAPLSLNGHY
ncbi:MAG: hypothetical protein EOM19_01425 [Candidatus Moranbacteria bacterium]|nr:hypothetical protein [Candidatus Moranbacteria bacterium]